MTALIVRTLVLLLIPALLRAGEFPPRYAVAISPMPVLNTPGFREVFGGLDGNSLKTDRCGQIRELEFIALPGTVFAIQEEIPGTRTTLYRVTTAEYPEPQGKGLFIDSRLVRTEGTRPPERNRDLPGRDEILKRLRSAKDVRYVWGGNVRTGIAELPEFYPPKESRKLSAGESALWMLAGLDCSGLLYEATGGWTPRNSGDLVQFGNRVAIEGLSADAIAKKLRPLDLIVWPGHLLIVIDNGEVIESRLFCDGRKSGVVIGPMKERVAEIMKTRDPLNSMGPRDKSHRKGFVARRWHEADTRGLP